MHPAIFTTSWDDGHPLDFRIAELLTKYSLAGTFYVPPKNQYCEVMSAAEIRQLSGVFEIGGHTLHHLPVDGLPDSVAREEIVAGKRLLEAIIGKCCRIFSFPL